MGFLEERQVAERALEAADHDDSEEAEFPPVAQRFVDAREALGLSQADVAERWGQPTSMYWDLEFHDSEAFDVVSVRELIQLASILRVSVFYLLFGDEPPAAMPSISYSELGRRVRERMETDGLSIDQMGDIVNVELGEYLHEPGRLADLPIAGLRPICRAVGVDWAAMLTGD